MGSWLVSQFMVECTGVEVGGWQEERGLQGGGMVLTLGE